MRRLHALLPGAWRQAYPTACHSVAQHSAAQHSGNSPPVRGVWREIGKLIGVQHDCRLAARLRLHFAVQHKDEPADQDQVCILGHFFRCWCTEGQEAGGTGTARRRNGVCPARGSAGLAHTHFPAFPGGRAVHKPKAALPPSHRCCTCSSSPARPRTARCPCQAACPPRRP